MRLQVPRGRTDIHPVRALRNVREEWFAFFQETWKQAVLKRIILALGNQVQDFWFEHVSSGVNVSTVGLTRLGFFDEPEHAAVFAGLDNSVHTGIFDGRQENRRGGLSLFV